MTLNILIDGRTFFAGPFYEELLNSTARNLHELLPDLRREGRVVVFINDDAGVAHLIAR
jgi:hypothetical protein